MNKLQSVISQQPLNLDYLEFTSHYELVILESFSGQIDVPPEGLRNLYHLVRSEIEATCVPSVEVERVAGPGAGCPKIVIERKISWIYICLFLALPNALVFLQEQFTED